MSTRNEVYLIRGVRLDVKKTFQWMEENSETEEEWTIPWCGKGATGKMGILADGMCGDYAVFGKVIAVKNEEGNEDFGILEINELMMSERQGIIERIKVLGAEDLVHPDSVGVKLYLISHYH